MANFSRRKFISIAGATAAGTFLANACSTPPSSTGGGGTTGGGAAGGAAAPAAINLSDADKPETTKAVLGFIALTDCAALVVAKEKGIFAKYGLPDVEVKKQPSWADTRGNLELGSDKGGIDGAHILTPMPYLMSLGKGTKGPVPMSILARLNTNGQGISVAAKYADLKLEADASKLKPIVDERKAKGDKFKCAVTFYGGTHDLWMRYWLAAGGINPAEDVDIVVIPPPQMVANMESNAMDAFCVGEPWNGRLVSKKLGYTAVTTGELWNNHPEKSFTMRADWVEKNPKAAKLLTAAIIEAQVWADKDENKEELCKILSGDKYVKAPVDDILARVKGNFDMGNGRKLDNSPLLMKFWREQASYPFKSHDTWFLAENIRWGYLPMDTDIKAVVDKVNREDIWKAAAKLAGQESGIPTDVSRGPETFFDGVKFDPADPKAYLASLKIKAAA
jgi:nitrate/nitrite transport system substrate-binding protein